MQQALASTGAWERQIKRRLKHPDLFDRPAPDNLALLAARQRDRRELEAFHQQLTQIVAELTDNTEGGQLLRLKQRLDDCHRQSYALAGDLREQQLAIGNINDIVTAALRRGLRDDDEAGRLRLIKHEAQRLRDTELWQYPLLADLAHRPSPIPGAELAASLLCEPAQPMLAALQQFDAARRREIARQWRAMTPKATCGNRELIASRIALTQPQTPAEASAAE